MKKNIYFYILNKECANSFLMLVLFSGMTLQTHTGTLKTRVVCFPTGVLMALMGVLFKQVNNVSTLEEF